MYTSTIDARTSAGRSNSRSTVTRAPCTLSSRRRATRSPRTARSATTSTTGKASRAAVDFDVLDAVLLKKLVGGRLRAIWENYAPYVAARREALNAPLLFEALERLATGWGAMSLEDAPGCRRRGHPEPSRGWRRRGVALPRRRARAMTTRSCAHHRGCRPAASRMRLATSAGFESIDTWLASSSIVVAPIRCAMNRSRPGSIVRS